ncbi:hypothetical protein GCM10007276_35500 [Agaricicola taiwanensis]|uniref:Lipoprotein n=1 Tax=Agaricicola taiwanensis TaxID=591372 RepID=A0A8J2YNC8_9RHOB|nr:hypothetical protein [Agaricicola taiwanensis]GGE55367.1 hypothetical protein GCM10007276_35500 [Agaricicola taiwanensis]
MIRKPAALCAALVVAACVSQEAVPQQRDTLGSEGWGPLRIGMAADDVTKALGSGGFGGGAACREYRPERAPEGLLVMLENGRLTRISLTGRSIIKTDAGLGLGAELAAVESAYGAAAMVSPAKYDPAPAQDITIWTKGAAGEAYVQNPDARGLRYEVGTGGKVTAIRAGGPSIQYVEGCS